MKCDAEATISIQIELSHAIPAMMGFMTRSSSVSYEHAQRLCQNEMRALYIADRDTMLNAMVQLCTG